MTPLISSLFHMYNINIHIIFRGGSMTFSYNKLWKLLIDNNMMKKDLKEKAKINSNTMANMGKGLPVSMEVLGRICVVLRCNIGDIVEVIYD